MKKFALTFLIILLLMGGIAAGVFLIRRQTEFREKAAPTSTITLVPSKSNPTVDEVFTVSANISTGENEILGAELHLSFDETKVEAMGASNGSFFTNPKNVGPSIDNNNGTLTYTVYLDPGATPRQGQGTVAVLTFKAKSGGNTTIALTSETNVGANSPGDLGENVLSGTTPAVLNIQGNTPTSTPIPTPTLTPTAGIGTSTPTPTLAVGGGTTGTITPTIDLLASPTPQLLPDSGMSVPTMLGVSLGAIILVGSMFLAL